MSPVNRCVIRETSLHPEKIHVWCVTSRSRIIGSIFFNTTVNSNVYCEDILYLFIETEEGFFQQDNTTAHTACESVDLLEDISGERIISLGL